LILSSFDDFDVVKFVYCVYVIKSCW